MSRLANDLLNELKTEFDLDSFQLAISNREFQFWRLRDPDAVLDETVIETPHADLAWQPYWAQVWDAAVGMCEVLAQLDLTGKHVLDLGCGLGITGAVAAAAGAQVTLADNAPPALKFAELNCAPWANRTTTVMLDWKKTHLTEQFDLILGADIVYDPDDLDFLDRFWRQHLGKNAYVLLSEPSRPMTGNLMDRLRVLKWRWNEFEHSSGLVKNTIRFFELRPN